MVCTGEDVACLRESVCVCVHPCVPLTHMLVPVKSRKLQAISVFKKGKKKRKKKELQLHSRWLHMQRQRGPT